MQEDIPTCEMVREFVRTRIIDFWNKLPSSNIDSSSIKDFKHMVDLRFIEHGSGFNTDDI